MSLLVGALKKLLGDVVAFVEFGGAVKLRSYQREIARAVIESVINKRGLTFVVMISRQGGKNEVQSHIEAFLLTLYSQIGGELVKASPTFKPQTENAMRRLEKSLRSHILTKKMWGKESGYIYKIGNARAAFFSAHEGANVVGATASVLLECDEAQDVEIAKWDKDFAPMAASTNATTLFCGTAWTDRTLLARELRAARVLEVADGLRRVFLVPWEAVAAEVPAYGDYVQKQIAKLGRNHPLIRTQYFLEEIGGEGGMFPEARRALMVGDHKRRVGPGLGAIYAMCIDLAGEDEDGLEGDELRMIEPRRDSTALTVFEVDLSSVSDELINAPTYKVVYRQRWTGTKHTALYGKLRGLIGLWKPRKIVVDATGVGAGLSSFLEKSYRGRVVPFVFSSKTKSDLFWNFLAVCDTGRFKEWTRELKHDEQEDFWRECDACQYEVREGAGKLVRWGVPHGTRNNETGELLHDDFLISAALCAVLDSEVWAVEGGREVVRGRDPLEDEKGF